ncbi:MAG: GNAT family N-acetyltransferase [Pseudonocardia sp.]|nr:GNAT family N-acetyltransferase [Pseudonocardia sp.]
MTTSVRAEACRIAATPDELVGHHAVRHAVFVEEQGVFEGSDLDAHDADPATIHVLGVVDGLVAGSVRIYVGRADGCWHGDRLAVLPAHRTGRLGGTLVRFAVATAAAHGGDRMTAMVQQANEVFFHHLGWRSTGPVQLYVGLPHVPMEITF